MNRARLEARLAQAVRAEVLTPEMEAGVMRQARKLIRERAAAPDRAAARRKELQETVRNLTDAVASGALRTSPALAARLTEAEEELAALPEPRKGAQISTCCPGRWARTGA